MINFPRQSIAAAVRAEMHGYALMAEISEDVTSQDKNLPHGKSIEIGSLLLLLLAHSVYPPLQRMAKLHDARVVRQDLYEK